MSKAVSCSSLRFRRVVFFVCMTFIYIYLMLKFIGRIVSHYCWCRAVAQLGSNSELVEKNFECDSLILNKIIRVHIMSAPQLLPTG